MRKKDANVARRMLWRTGTSHTRAHIPVKKGRPLSQNACCSVGPRAEPVVDGPPYACTGETLAKARCAPLQRQSLADPSWENPAHVWEFVSHDNPAEKANNVDMLLETIPRAERMSKDVNAFATKLRRSSLGENYHG